MNSSNLSSVAQHDETASSGISRNDGRNDRLLAMGQMAASLAHEVRNPLGSMELFCGLLLKELGDRPETQNLAKQIQLGIRTIDRIIANCLQFTRDIRPHRQLVSAQSYLENILAQIAPQANAQRVELSLQTRGDASANIDPHLFEQALMNLILNAVQAAGANDKTEARQVSLCSSSGPNAWVLEIEDNGIGIERENLSKIFDPFFTTKTSGTGLGLAIVHSIVTAHGGELIVESEVGQGTTFKVVVPNQ